MVLCEYPTYSSTRVDLCGLPVQSQNVMVTENSHVRAAQIAMSLGEPSAVPPVITKALQTLKDPRYSSRDLARLISMDHAVTARLIAMANTACVDRSTALGTVGEAIMCLGYKNTQAILFAASAYTALCRPVTLYGLERDELWRHSITCAISSRVIAREYGLWDPDEAYVAGLLHDIGLPALERFVRRKSKIVDLIRTADYPPFIAEQMVLGFDHAYLGSLICQNWQLTNDLVVAISTHHEPMTREHPDMLSAVTYLADTVSLMPELGVSSRRQPTNADPSVMEWLGLEPGDIDNVIPQVRAYLKQLGVRTDQIETGGPYRRLE